MAERFMVDDAGTLIDILTRDTYDYVDDVCPVLNKLWKQTNRFAKHNKELSEENEQLKNSIQYQYDEHKRVVNNYVDKVKELQEENEQLKKGKWQCRLCGFTGTIEHICRKKGDVE